MGSSLRQSLLFAWVLASAGLLIIYTKVVQLDYPIFPDTERTIWDFETYLEFDAMDQPARLEVFIPVARNETNILEEQFFNGPFGLSLMDDDVSSNRKAVWTHRFPSDRKVLRYRAQIVGENRRSDFGDNAKFGSSRQESQAPDPIRAQALLVWGDRLRRQSADARSFALIALDDIFAVNPSDEVQSLMPDLPAPVNKLALAVEVFAQQKISARIANGVYLTEARRRAEIKHWLEYRADGRDFRYFIDDEPASFFPIWYGTERLIDARGVRALDAQIALSSGSRLAQELAQQSGGNGVPSPLVGFGFQDLPLTTQLVYKVLITIPVGIVLLVFLRQFIGVSTLGTFMPVLIGISFRETALLNGIILFTVLVGLGLTMRIYLERLQLLLVPRLAVVLVFIVVCMVGITLLMNESNRSIGLSVSLFPMVILTMTIERMSIVWEEYSGTEAMKQGAGSLVVASICYLVMTNNLVEHFMFTFPETLFILMAICLLMGRYTGMRLSEIWRFRHMVQQNPSV